MILHYRKYAAHAGTHGEPLLILHGLYGQQGNWATQARVLAAAGFTVLALDARNHGQSPHADSMTLQEMMQDVVETMNALGLDAAHVMGHSMGGKIAMLLALFNPGRVLDLIVVDIAPVSYATGDVHVITGLQALDLADLRSRGQADEQLAAYISGKQVRDFLLTNLLRNGDGAYGWRFNLTALAKYFSEIIKWPATDRQYASAVMFIKGEDSDYILPEYEAAILALFPKASLETVTDAGHWVHSENPETFQQLVLKFLLDQTTDIT